MLKKCLSPSPFQNVNIICQFWTSKDILYIMYIYIYTYTDLLDSIFLHGSDADILRSVSLSIYSVYYILYVQNICIAYMSTLCIYIYIKYTMIEIYFIIICLNKYTWYLLRFNVSWNDGPWCLTWDLQAWIQWTTSTMVALCFKNW